MNLRKAFKKKTTKTLPSNVIHYTVIDTWQWVMKRVSKESSISGYTMKEIEDRINLPSTTLLQQQEQSSSSTTRRNFCRKKKKKASDSTVTLDVMGITTTNGKNTTNSSKNNGQGEELVLKSCHHGISSALDGLEDKDELVRTFQRCRIDHLGYAPPSQLIQWDITLAECQKRITKLPSLQQEELDKNTNDDDDEVVVAVLKEPLSSQGKGIHFVTSVQEIFDVMENHRNMKSSDDFLDEVMETKGRIPCWVLQSEIYPAMLIRDRKKFHIRMYILVMETYEDGDLLVHLYLYNRQEVRIAAQPVEDDDNHNTGGGKERRNPSAHITNGGFTGDNNADNKENNKNNKRKRVLLTEVKELVPYIPALEFFCANTFLQLLPDITRRVGCTVDDQPAQIQKHVLAGVDIMMTESGKPYLLEVNVNPRSPPTPDEVSSQFQSHLVSFLDDMINLVVFGKNDTNQNNNNNSGKSKNSSSKNSSKNNSSKSNNFVRLEDIVDAALLKQQQQHTSNNNNNGR